MSENEMGNHGSKSDFITKFEKEQRVDGSWYGVNIPYLRCTLTGFERNCLIKVPSNQIKKLILYSAPLFEGGTFASPPRLSAGGEDFLFGSIISFTGILRKSN